MEKAKEMRSPRDRKFVRSLKPRTCAPEKQYLGIKNHNDDPWPIANPHEVSPDWNNAILHARICIGETKILGADNGGQIFMPMQETFFRHPLCDAQAQVRHILESDSKGTLEPSVLTRGSGVSCRCHGNGDEWRQMTTKTEKRR